MRRRRRMLQPYGSTNKQGTISCCLSLQTHYTSPCIDQQKMKLSSLIRKYSVWFSDFARQDPVEADPPSVGCRFDQGRAPGRLYADTEARALGKGGCNSDMDQYSLNSSDSDLENCLMSNSENHSMQSSEISASESHMTPERCNDHPRSLSHSSFLAKNDLNHESDSPGRETKECMNISTSPGDNSETLSMEPQPCRPRKRQVVRQLSSNPYLASSEMSPSDDHPLIMGSHSFAAGESRFYANDDELREENSTNYYGHIYSQRTNSYPLTSDCHDEEEDENSDDGDDDDSDENDDDKQIIKESTHCNHPKTDNISITGGKPQRSSFHTCTEVCQKEGDGEIKPPQLGVSPIADPNYAEQTQKNHHHFHHHHNQHGQDREQQFQYHNHQHHNHFHQQQQQFCRNLYSDCSGHRPCDSKSTPGNRVNGIKWNTDQNTPYTAGNSTPGFSDILRAHHQRTNAPCAPKSREVNSWGHFYKISESHYKYRRSHYSSDSDEENSSGNVKYHQKQSSGRNSTSKSHVPSKRCNNHPSTQSPTQHKNDLSPSQPQRLDEKRAWSQNGMKPQQFKESFQLMKRLFSECNDGQKNIVLKGLLSLCELPQLHLLSVHMSKELHHGCPSNCEDIITWLPTDLATKVMSYLDPVSLCHAAQVCRVWRQLAEDQSLWRRFCCQTKWRLSKAAEHKQVISHMCPEGSIQWKNVFAERYRLRNNWLKGRCTVRTFEGHSQGISCVQFDDSRIVSGSSDKTIKVWNMRTNAPWSVQTLMGHHGTVRCLHLEGNRLVSGSCDKTIKVWDLSAQESWSSIACKVTMTGHRDTVRCLQADDDKVISGSYDRTLKIWDLKSGEVRKTLRGHLDSVLCVHFSETKIVSGSADNSIKVWNYEGHCVMTLSGHQDAVTCLMFDSTRIVSGSLDHNLKFWDIHTGKCLNTIDWKKAEGHTDVVRCLQADSWRVVSAGDDKTIKVWNLATGERLVTLRNHTDGVTCLQFNDFIIVSGSYDKSVKLWDFSCC